MQVKSGARRGCQETVEYRTGPVFQGPGGYAAKVLDRAKRYPERYANLA